MVIEGPTRLKSISWKLKGGIWSVSKDNCLCKMESGHSELHLWEYIELESRSFYSEVECFRAYSCLCVQICNVYNVCIHTASMSECISCHWGWPYTKLCVGAPAWLYWPDPVCSWSLLTGALHVYPGSVLRPLGEPWWRSLQVTKIWAENRRGHSFPNAKSVKKWTWLLPRIYH